MSPESTASDYVQFLSRTLGFIEPIEELLHSQSVAALTTPLWAPNAKRAPLIKQDLESMGMSLAEIAALPRMAKLPSVETTGQMMGVSYVIEGSMMGGLVLAKQVKKHLSLDESVMSFFLPEEPKSVAGRFEQFAHAFDGFARCSCEEEQALAAAHQTFELVYEWFNANRPAVDTL